MNTNQLMDVQLVIASPDPTISDPYTVVDHSSRLHLRPMSQVIQPGARAAAIIRGKPQVTVLTRTRWQVHHWLILVDDHSSRFMAVLRPHESLKS